MFGPESCNRWLCSRRPEIPVDDWARHVIPCRYHCGMRWSPRHPTDADRKSTRLNSSHGYISYAVFCLKKKTDRPGEVRDGKVGPLGVPPRLPRDHSLDSELRQGLQPRENRQGEALRDQELRRFRAPGDDPTGEGLRQTPTRVEASLKWLTRGYHMAVADVIGDALYSERHENLVCVRDIEIYSLCDLFFLTFCGPPHFPFFPNGRLFG